MTRHALMMLAAGSLAALGLAACAHSGVKPAEPAANHKPAVTLPSAATATHAISVAPEAGSTVVPSSQTRSSPATAPSEAPPVMATVKSATASSARPAATGMSPSAASNASTPAVASAAMSTAAPTASEAPATSTSTAAPASELTGPSMPVRGMSMANVEHIFGAPLQKLPAVPDPGSKLHPPITRWIYPTYVVYFEYNYVVHTVLKAHPFAESKPDHP